MSFVTPHESTQRNRNCERESKVIQSPVGAAADFPEASNFLKAKLVALARRVNKLDRRAFEAEFRPAHGLEPRRAFGGNLTPTQVASMLFSDYAQILNTGDLKANEFSSFLTAALLELPPRLCSAVIPVEWKIEKNYC